MGHPQPDALSSTLSDQMARVLRSESIIPGEGILHHEEGVDIIPANIELAGLEVSLVNAMSRETTLKRVLAAHSKDYDHILLDCCPSLGMLTINALSASDRIIIPVQAQYLSVKGVEQTRAMDSPVWQDDAVFKLYLYCLSKASHNSCTWRGIQIEPGDLPASERHMAEALRWSRCKVQRKMGELCKIGLISKSSISAKGTPDPP